MPTIAAYIGAALFEIAGCFAFWGWLRLGKPVWWLLTAPIWFGIARIATTVNPNGHHVFAVMLQVTPLALLNRRRRHVS